MEFPFSNAIWPNIPLAMNLKILEISSPPCARKLIMAAVMSRVPTNKAVVITFLMVCSFYIDVLCTRQYTNLIGIALGMEGEFIFLHQPKCPKSFQYSDSSFLPSLP